MNILDDDQISDMLAIIDRNETSILNALQIFVEMTQNLAIFSNIIYNDKNKYPLALYKTFRKLSESAQGVSNILQIFQSNNNEFLQQRDDLICQQIRYLESMNNQGEKQSENENNYNQHQQRNKKYRRNQSLGQQSTINYLQKQVSLLNEALQRDNFEFQLEIKKYNSRLYEMQQTIERYEIQFQKVQEYIVAIEDLENKIVLMREEKYRDQLIIENMAKKIRFFEKEKGGRQAFLSPRTNQRSRYLQSPQSNIKGADVYSYYSKRSNYQ